MEPTCDPACPSTEVQDVFARMQRELAHIAREISGRLREQELPEVGRKTQPVTVQWEEEGFHYVLMQIPAIESSFRIYLVVLAISIAVSLVFDIADVWKFFKNI